MKKSLSITGAILLTIALAIAPTNVAQAASCVKVKNVVGKNYQAAQDIWRAQGFYVMPAKDGKGRGRISFLDRNWKVIAQTPKANKCVAKYSDVRATIVKYTD